MAKYESSFSPDSVYWIKAEGDGVAIADQVRGCCPNVIWIAKEDIPGILALLEEELERCE